MRNGRKLVRDCILLILTLVVLITPQVHSAFMNQTFAKNLYPSTSYIITTKPVARFPADHVYCYIGQNDIDITMVFHGFEMDSSITEHIDEQLERADIYISWNYVVMDTDYSDVYFDFEYEPILNDYRDEYDSDYVISLTYMSPPADGVYYNLAGYARLKNHCALVFTETLGYDSYISSIALHELCHLLGYGHSDNSDCIMYPYYDGGNNNLAKETVTALYDLHH